MSAIADQYEAFQAAIGSGENDKAAAPYKALVAAVNDKTVNPLLRMKALKCISGHGGLFEAQLKDTMKAIVTSLSEEDDEAIQSAAVEAIVGFSKSCTLNKSKKGEFVVRESTDVLMQLAIDESRSEAIKKAANDGIIAMVACDFKAVITKQLHWLSDDREDDNQEYLAKERSFALDKLSTFARGSQLSNEWTDELVASMFKYFTVVFPTITLPEYTRLIAIVVAIPQVKKDPTPLVDVVLSGKYKDDRLLEMLVVLGSHLPKTFKHDSLATRLFSELSKFTGESNAANTLIAKGAVIASRAITEAAAAKVVPSVVTAVKTAIGNPENITALEGLLIAFNTVGYLQTIPFKETLDKDEWIASVNALLDRIKEMQPQLLFAVKKKVNDGTATQKDAVALLTLDSIATILKAHAAKEIASTVTTLPSWERKAVLPKIKKTVGGQGAITGKAAGVYKAPQGNGNGNAAKGTRGLKRRRQ